MRKLLLLLLPIAACSAAIAQNPDSLRIAKLEERVSELERKSAAVDYLTEHVKLSGLIQGQWSWSDERTDDVKNKFTIRRARLRTQYDHGIAKAVFQLNVTETSVDIHDAFIALSPGYVGTFTMGYFSVPFGDEHTHNPFYRITPENSRVFNTLLGSEKDLGVKWRFLEPDGKGIFDISSEVGIINGNGGRTKEIDSRKNFVTRNMASLKLDNITMIGGFSYYHGSIKLQEGYSAYKVDGNAFAVDNKITPGKYAKRRYLGVDLRIIFGQPEGGWIGDTEVRLESLTGKQPGTAGSTISPNRAVYSDIYSRDFFGTYAVVSQEIYLGKTSHTLIAKYDMYDPNTDLKKNENMTDGDIKYHTYGLGWIYSINSYVRLMAFYEFVNNEKTDNGYVSEKFRKDIKDDILTLRLSMRF